MAHTTITQGNIIRFPVERCRGIDPLMQIAMEAKRDADALRASLAIDAKAANEAAAIRAKLREGKDERRAQLLESVSKRTGYSVAALAQLDPLEVLQIDGRHGLERLDAARDKPIGSVKVFEDEEPEPQDKPTKKQSARTPKHRSTASRGGSK